MRQQIRLLLTLALFWLLLSGLLKPFLLTLGVLSIALVIVLSRKMKVLLHQGQDIYFPVLQLLRYWCWLFIEIIKSNIDVARMILSPSMPIKPRLKIIPATQKTEVGRVIYANSITLTPGTVALNISLDGGIIVHALHEDSIAELEQGTMDAYVAKLENSVKAGGSQ